jgi:surface antigen-like variable number repeat protein
MDTRTLSSWMRSVAVASLTLLLAPVSGTAQQQEEGRGERQSRASEISAAEREEWRTLANGRFMTGDVKGALDALNKIGEPRVGSIKIEGLVRTNPQVVNEYLGLEPGELLTAKKLTRIERRLEELPVATSANVRYDPIGGSAHVTPIISERNPFPRGPLDWTPVAIRATFMQEARVQISDPTGAAEVWTPAFRWAANRPRAMLQVGAPAPGKLPGLVQLETFWERQTYQSPSLGNGVFREERFRAGAGLSDWITSWLRWEGGAAVDFIEFATYLGLDGSLNTRAFGDRFALIMTGGQWYAMGKGDSFVNGELVMTARSTAKKDVPVLTTLAGIAVASKMAPLAVWPGASSGQGRAAQLRAHPLLSHGIITGEVFGRQVLFTSTEYEYPFTTTIGTVGVAGFVDTAQATLRLDPTTPSKLQVDIGGGLRFNTSRAGNKVRLDFGYGLRDSRVRLSAAYVLPWGRR